ncbi:MAG TPA: 50S ribosomal protein L6 [Bacillota bacterium]|nr:50S ribosomal protein L6 [Bacillota bacterium]
MSRVGRKPIPVPAGVQVSTDHGTVRVKGPKGELVQELPQGIEAELKDGRLLVSRADDERHQRALHGLSRSLLANMVEGVTGGFTKPLELVGTGYRAAKAGRKLILTVGYSHPVEIEPPDGVEIDVPTPASVVVRGIDKQAVGQLAAVIRDVRPPEPYLGKGIRYAGEHVRRKVGKTGK